jgi:hypothetical protein
MLKTVVFWLFLQPLSFFCPDGSGAVTENCPAVSGFHKTGETASTFSVAWLSVGDATQYKVWCVRQSDSCVVTSASTTGTTYTFTDLAPGRYVFYVATVCGSDESGFIGIEDIIEV